MPITFLHPLILLGVFVLPLLYFLLKILPPAPKKIILPTARFLLGLRPDESTTQTTPLWVLLLRLILLTSLIFALAKPVYKPDPTLSTQNDIALIIDNNWASAQNWDTIVAQANMLIDSAENNDKAVLIMPLYNEANAPTPNFTSAAEAKARVKTMKPFPHEGRPVIKQDIFQNADIYLLSSGVTHPSMISSLSLEKTFTPTTDTLPIIIHGNNLQDITLETPHKNTIPIIINAHSSSGDTVAQTVIRTEKNKRSYPVKFDALSPNYPIANLTIAGQNHAAGILLLNTDQGTKNACHASPIKAKNSTPFIQASYYITRALSPYTTVSQGSIEVCLDKKPAVLITTDYATLSAEQIHAITAFVESGGVFIRFAVKGMIKTDTLHPIPLRGQGDRSLDGVLTWETPLTVGSISDESPLAGLTVPTDISVSQHILTQTPTTQEQNRIWVALEDGTPFITGTSIQNGFNVFIHTTPAPDWSDFALSHFYVQVLKRLLDITTAPRHGGEAINVKNINTLKPIQTLDGFGNAQKPPPHIKPIGHDEFDTVAPSYNHPPGIYGNGIYKIALNLGNHVQNKAITSGQTYTNSVSMSLAPFLFALAMILFCIDWMAMVFIFGHGMRVVISALTLFTFTVPVHAQDNTYIDGFYLGYIQSGSTSADSKIKEYLQQLQRTLNQRTSVITQGVTAVDPKKDELAFFPILYWQIDQTQTLDSKTITALQNYMNNGGMLVVRTPSNSSYAKETLKKLNIPALAPVPDDHVIRKSFYLMDAFDNAFGHGGVWLASNNDELSDHITPIILDMNNWAQISYRGIAGEPALRFGVNTVMMALIGNYKNDQVHIPAILERMKGGVQ